MSKKGTSKAGTVKDFVTNAGQEMAVSLPILSMVGNDEVTIENFQSIVEYGQEVIRLRTKLGQIMIEGKNLIAKSMNQEEIVINGDIKSINFLK